ncbi:MAG TPA: isoleucine--tRNA ligase [Vicinamibacterales bacterium]|nr:isoleucine--tRNA ligase [Vicinamibacterales bacterium]
MPEWKDTCNLPRTAFSMKANLQAAEPEAISRWQQGDLYGQLRRARSGAQKFVLHDGPPYANGEIHIGTALNKVLKDFVVKSRSMAGLDAPYVPGWDCHGLPIELKVDRQLGPEKRQMSVADFRRACQAYAAKYVDIMREDFKRLGVFGEWDDPYLTMKPSYQADIVRALGRFVEQGMVYKGKKPVHWCMHCRTALAEAEVEYEPHTSPSIYVEFPLKAESAAELGTRVPELTGKQVSVLIWTTTPWTIPSNLAVAFHPDFVYGAYEVRSGPVAPAQPVKAPGALGAEASAKAAAGASPTVVIVATDLAEAVGSTLGRPLGAPLATFEGRVMERLVFEHPLYGRDSLGVLGDYVTLEAGTGVVHTAPGHGADDYHTGISYGLDIYGPLDPGGHYLDSVELFGGIQVLDANPKVEAALAERGRLWHREDYDHSYPHCWRCHNPVIFLATSQWFIAMDHPDGSGDFRRRALEAIDATRWIPSWGRERIYNMIANRPDWCISRQRSWGVPIPAVDCTSCGTAILTRALTDRTAAVFDRHGADAWYERPIEEFLPEGLTCASCGGREFEREYNILDVWFDSGSSHEAVLPRWPDLRWPADLYLEGSDQHRGWFHSSLLVGLGTRGRAPFDQVLTHGFVVDEHGRKMSKSLGNTIAPQDVMKQSGADVLRLWVSMVDYREDIRLGKEILARVVEAYRKFRNVLRVLLANLYDFDPQRDQVPQGRMVEVDRWAMARYASVASKIVRAYDDYDYPAIYHAANQFITVDLSAFYVDITKDRMYTLGAKSEARRSGQTAMFLMVDGLARLLAPILPFTMDEVWRTLPGAREPSVHLALFPSDFGRWQDDARLDRWGQLSIVRNAVNVALEEKRQQKVITSSLSARVGVAATGALAQLLAETRDDLPTLFGVSQVDLDEAYTEAAEQSSGVQVRVERADGVKCERCWRFVAAVTPEGICDRCVEALAEPVSG